MGGTSRDIICSSCGAETLLRVEPVYDGFRKTGERNFCASCGFEFQPDQIPFKEKKTISIFTDADKEKRVDIFSGDEKGRNCRYCAHYTVNPFTQRCGLTNKIVQATDQCDKFAPRETAESPDGKKE